MRFQELTEAIKFVPVEPYLWVNRKRWSILFKDVKVPAVYEDLLEQVGNDGLKSLVNLWVNNNFGSHAHDSPNHDNIYSIQVNRFTRLLITFFKTTYNNTRYTLIVPLIFYKKNIHFNKETKLYDDAESLRKDLLLTLKSVK